MWDVFSSGLSIVTLSPDLDNPGDIYKAGIVSCFNVTKYVLLHSRLVYSDIILMNDNITYHMILMT